MGCGGRTTSVSFFAPCTADSSVTNSSEACGGRNRVSVYSSTSSVTAFPVPIVQTTKLPGNWKYSHCLAYVYFAFLNSCNRPGAAHSDQQRPWCPPGLPVSDYIPTEQHCPKLFVAMFKIRLPRGRHGIWTRVLCVISCYAAFHGAAHGNTSVGCGDVADITNNGGTTAAETDCSMACSGDPLHLCGGFYKLQLYFWNGNLNTWNTPANTGRYEVRTPCLVFARCI